MSIRQANVQEIQKMHRDQSPDRIWIDVRQPEEWSEGTIPGIRRISLAELPAQIGTFDKTKTYVLVCRSGGRSGRACQTMQQAGFEHLINFDGGMLSWYQSGLPLA